MEIYVSSGETSSLDHRIPLKDSILTCKSVMFY